MGHTEQNGYHWLGHEKITEYFDFRDVDDVHDMMDDIAEQQEIANEIGEAISNPIGFGQDMDEVNFSCIFIMSPPPFGRGGTSRFTVVSSHPNVCLRLCQTLFT